MTGRRKLFIFIALPLVIIFGAVAFIAARKDGDVRIPASQTTGETAANVDPWGDKCQVKETGRKELTASPMAVADIAQISPMGMTAGGHVTPIDHMYFYPAETPGNRFSAKVYAAADGIITNIQHRGDLVDGPADANSGSDEFRLTIEQTCNQGYYYDLITKLTPEIKKVVGTLKGYDGKNVSIKVKAGDLIGYVGNQSLDFGVYDTDVTLSFINPASYTAEPWKIHTADAFSYFTKETFATFEPKVLRLAEPRSGKIDYDKDGYLIGNWFEKGTNGYGGKMSEGSNGYWSGHLAMLYDAFDPKLITISVGEFTGNDPQAFAVKGNAPDPATVNKDSGLVKYELVGSVSYRTDTGQPWDRKTPATVTGTPGSDVKGVILFQLIEPRLLKMELFPGKTAAEVTTFTASARLYER